MPINKTEIEWVVNPDGKQGYGANPIRGYCKHNCDYCYAEAHRNRFTLPAEISWHPEVLRVIKKKKKPATIFIGSMHDIFGAWIEEDWLVAIHHTVKETPHHIFLFLTKNPSRESIKYGMFNFSNVWLGASILTTARDGDGDVFQLRNDLLASKHNQLFFSAEPLLEAPPSCLFEMSPADRTNIKWIIIGTLNKNGRPVRAENGGTKLEWIIGLVKSAQMYNIPIFIKKECYVLHPKLLEMFGELKEIPYWKTHENAN